MNKNIRITWPAWLWINTTSDIIWNIISDLWYSVLTDIEYESRIKWWVNYFDINFSDKIPYISNRVDILLVFSLESLIKNIDFLKKWASIFLSFKIKEKIKEDILSKLNKNNINLIYIDINDKYDNTYLLWLLSCFLDIPFSIVESNLKEVFLKKWKEIFNYNLDIIKDIRQKYSNIVWNFSLKRIWDKKNFIYWNKAIAYGAINSKLEYYSAYPMTPASTILTEIINSKKVKYLQAEDELAVINSALWASYCWFRSMCASSWWWFALMSEALSFAIQAEFPITVVLSQRAWPSTWTPTYHEAGDLNFALNPTFWDFDHIVLYPSSVDEAYYFWWLALNLADKYQTIVLILLDKQLSEIFATTDELISPKIDRWIILDKPPQDYKRYEITQSWVSPRVMVWTKWGDFISTSYEHDEYGATTEDPEMKKLMTQKRFKKLENFYKKEWFSWYEIINSKAQKMFITTSATSYTLRAFIENNKEFWLIIIKIIKPLDERLLDEIKSKKELIFVENNYSWQLENYITKEFGLKYIDWLNISNFRKYDLFPFYYEEFENRYINNNK